MTIVPRHVLVTHSLRPAPSCSEVLPLPMTWHIQTAPKCSFCKRQDSGSEGCAPTSPCSVHICPKPDHPSQTRQVQLLKANPKWQNWRQMKEHRGRVTDNAAQTKKKKSNYKPEKQTSGTLKHFPSLEWKAVTMGITMCQLQPSLTCIILAQPFKESKSHWMILLHTRIPVTAQRTAEFRNTQ